jgi:dTDP-4-dehydrorhamnose 3,5-epimerase
MPLIETEIKGLFVFEPRLYKDERGYFFESFNQNVFLEKGIDVCFVQDNQSYSAFGVLRGLHFQKPPFQQAKLVRVLSGEVLDVVVDLRRESETFGRWYSIILSSENKKQLFVPRGFAHGFVVLSKTAEFFYKCDNYYSPEFESGILYNDDFLQIDWGLNISELIVSEKDKLLQNFSAELI